MRNTMTIFKREYAAYFNSPIAYIFIIAFLVLNSGLFMTGFFLNQVADLRSFFGNLPFFLIFFIPAVSMRLWAEDKRTGTFELLMTLPMPARDIMLGKYLAALAFYLVALAGTLPLVVMVAALGNPDLGAIWSGYIGSILLGALYLGIGTFTSGLTRDQISAVILGIMACFLVFILGVGGVAATIDGWIPGLGSFLQDFVGLANHFDMMLRGVVSIGDLAYFLGLTALFLTLNTLWLEGRKY
ncbi:ABC transporter permease [bacterium]|nr:ABC transporter permease [bacterium]PJA73929.1 MAG: ABC transporter [bacterium CG_4_9_14_3_um_filter_65_15]